MIWVGKFKEWGLKLAFFGFRSGDWFWNMGVEWIGGIESLNFMLSVFSQ